MRLKIVMTILAALLLTGCAAGEEEKELTASETSGSEKTESTAAEAEKAVLTFEAATISGESVTSDCFSESKLTMINVWATYCNPCLSEMPDLGALAKSYDSADFQILGIISDVAEGATSEDIEIAEHLIEQTGADYPHLLLNQSLYSNLVGGVSSVPTTFFVTQEGEVLGYVLGAQSKESWESIVNELLTDM